MTCKRSVEGRNSHAGHYVPKAACGLEYYFSEENVNCQCAGCNLFLAGNHPAYRKYMLSHYGQDVLDDIEKNYRNPCHDYPFEEKIEHYKSLVDNELATIK